MCRLHVTYHREEYKCPNPAHIPDDTSNVAGNFVHGSYCIDASAMPVRR